MISRRSLLLGAPALIAAPAIVRAASLMAVKPIAMNNTIIAVDTAFGDFDTALMQYRAHEVYSNSAARLVNAVFYDVEYDAPHWVVRDSYS